MINKITIERQKDNWWEMVIDYEDGDQFCCRRPHLKEIMDELKHHVV